MIHALVIMDPIQVQFIIQPYVTFALQQLPIVHLVHTDQTLQLLNVCHVPMDIIHLPSRDQRISVWLVQQLMQTVQHVVGNKVVDDAPNVLRVMYKQAVGYV